MWRVNQSFERFLSVLWVWEHNGRQGTANHNCFLPVRRRDGQSYRLTFHPSLSTQSKHATTASCEPFACLVTAIWDASEHSLDHLSSSLTVVKAHPPKTFSTETVSMRFSAEEKELRSDSSFKGSGLRMRRCNFAAKDQESAESFKSSFLHHDDENCVII